MAFTSSRREVLVRVVCAAVLAAWVATGCSAKGGCACSWFAKKKVPEAPAYTDVVVLSQGSDPRVVLRVARWSGLRYRSKLEASGSVALEGVPPLVGPTTTMVVDSEVLRGSADPLVERQDGGLVRLIEERTVLRSVSIRQEGVPQQILDFWNQLLLPLRGTSYLQHVAESAEIARLNSELFGGVQPPQAVNDAVDQALEQQRHFPFRLPPAPVGVGARWRFHETLEVNGAHTNQIAEMTLKHIDANQALVGIALHQDAPRQAIAKPLVPGGTNTVLEQYRGDGGGELTVDRLTAVVLFGTITVTARSTVSADVAGQHNVATLLAASSVHISTTFLSDEDAAAP
jgi:hypothetical protein